MGVPPYYSKIPILFEVWVYFIYKDGFGKMKREIGILDKKLAIKKGIVEHAGKKIVQHTGLLKHIEKHEKEYISIESCKYTINNIPAIIKNPDYVYYNKEKRGLEFYKELMENVCVVIQIVDKRELYVASVYPVQEKKILNRKYKDKYEQHVMTEEEYNERNNLQMQ